MKQFLSCADHGKEVIVFCVKEKCPNKFNCIDCLSQHYKLNHEPEYMEKKFVFCRNMEIKLKTKQSSVVKLKSNESSLILDLDNDDHDQLVDLSAIVDRYRSTFKKVIKEKSRNLIDEIMAFINDSFNKFLNIHNTYINSILTKKKKSVEILINYLNECMEMQEENRFLNSDCFLDYILRYEKELTNIINEINSEDISSNVDKKESEDTFFFKLREMKRDFLDKTDIAIENVGRKDLLYSKYMSNLSNLVNIYSNRLSEFYINIDNDFENNLSIQLGANTTNHNQIQQANECNNNVNFGNNKNKQKNVKLNYLDRNYNIIEDIYKINHNLNENLKSDINVNTNLDSLEKDFKNLEKEWDNQKKFINTKTIKDNINKDDSNIKNLNNTNNVLKKEKTKFVDSEVYNNIHQNIIKENIGKLTNKMTINTKMNQTHTNKINGKGKEDTFNDVTFSNIVKISKEKNDNLKTENVTSISKSKTFKLSIIELEKFIKSHEKSLDKVYLFNSNSVFGKIYVDPLETNNNCANFKFYYQHGVDTHFIFQFDSFKHFMENRIDSKNTSNTTNFSLNTSNLKPSRIIQLNNSLNDTYSTIYNNHLYYFDYINKKVVKHDLDSNKEVSKVNIENIVGKNICLNKLNVKNPMIYTCNELSNIIFFSQLDGLYFLYNDYEENNILVKLNPVDLSKIYSLNMNGITKNKSGPFCMVNSKLYTVKSFRESPTYINYCYDIKKRVGCNVFVEFENKGSYDTSLTYISQLNILITVNNGNIYYYELNKM